MKVRYILSNKVGAGCSSEIYLMAQPYIDGKLFTMRAKTGIFINRDYFDKADGIKTLSRRHVLTPDVRYHQEQAARLQSLAAYIVKAFNEADKSEMEAGWLKQTVDKYQHPERQAAAQKTFFDYAGEYISKKQPSAGYIRSFNVMVRDVARFTGYTRATDKKRANFTFDVNKVSRDDIEAFMEYLKAEYDLAKEYPALFARLLAEYPTSLTTKRKTIERRGNNTIHGITKKLRAFFLWMYKTGRTENRPFDGVEIVPEMYGAPIYITTDERERIAAAPMPTKQLETQRDIFVFQCLIGCRVSDLMTLTEKNITDGILSYTPHKTKDEGKQSVVARIPLIDDALQLIEKYKDVDKRGRLFPFISSDKYNDAIKKIFVVAGITRNVGVRNSLTGETDIKPISEVATSHMARRTFAGNLYQEIKDPAIIGRMTGHVDGSKAFARYRNIEDSTLKAAVKYLKK